MMKRVLQGPAQFVEGPLNDLLCNHELLNLRMKKELVHVCGPSVSYLGLLSLLFIGLKLGASLLGLGSGFWHHYGFPGHVLDYF